MTEQLQELIERINREGVEAADSKGKEIAEKLAQKLEYDCISREILLQASRQFNVKKLNVMIFALNL